MVIDMLGIQSITIPITEMVESLIRRYPEASTVRMATLWHVPVDRALRPIRRIP